MPEPIGNRALPAGNSVRRYDLSHTTLMDARDRLLGMVGHADGLQVEADPRTNSLIVVGEPEAVEAALVSGLDVAQGAQAEGE